MKISIKFLRKIGVFRWNGVSFNINDAVDITNKRGISKSEKKTVRRTLTLKDIESDLEKENLNEEEKEYIDSTIQYR